MWIQQINAVLGSLVVTIGLWIAAGDLPVELALFIALAVAIFLVWVSSHVLTIWAWTTALMGAESLAWPIVLMVQVKRSGIEPTEEQMQTLLTAMLFGLFSSIFWMTFSYGLFKWAARATAPPAPPDATPSAGQPAADAPSRKRKRQRR